MKLRDQQNAEDISSCMKKFLAEHKLAYIEEGMQRYDVFDVCLPATEFISEESHVTVYVHSDMILLEADVPVTRIDKNVLGVIANQLNMQYMAGVYQVDLRYGESNWQQYIPLREKRWPGDERMLSGLHNTAYMAGKIYQMLNSLTRQTETMDVGV